MAGPGATDVDLTPERPSPAEAVASLRSWRRRARWARVVGLLLAAVWVAVDQVSKERALATLADGPVPVVDGVFQLRLAFNYGAAFSTAQELTEVITVVASVVSVGLVVGILRTTSVRWGVALGFLLGGALGNLVDRFIREPGWGRGAVVDFFDVPRFPVFNLADSAITVAAASIVLLTVMGVAYRSPAPQR